MSWPILSATVRRKLDYVELSRLLCLSAMSRPWIDKQPSTESVRLAMENVREFAAFFEASAGKSSTVLFLCDADGGVIFDLAVAKSLIRMGHKVIFAVKSGFFSIAPTLEDMEIDPSHHTDDWRRHGVARAAHEQKQAAARAARAPACGYRRRHARAH